MFKQRQRERAERRGFEDALVRGRPDPCTKPDHEAVGYGKGFMRGEQAIARIIAKTNRQLGQQAVSKLDSIAAGKPMN